MQTPMQRFVEALCETPWLRLPRVSLLKLSRRRWLPRHAAHRQAELIARPSKRRPLTNDAFLSGSGKNVSRDFAKIRCTCCYSCCCAETSYTPKLITKRAPGALSLASLTLYLFFWHPIWPNTSAFICLFCLASNCFARFPAN